MKHVDRCALETAFDKVVSMLRPTYLPMANRFLEKGFCQTIDATWRLDVLSRMEH